MKTKTDWDLIRSMMNTAIDACARIEAAGYDETQRGLVVDTEHGQATVYDLIVSAFTFPENMRYQIIRARHEAGADLPYVHEFSRVLTAMAQASAELVGAKDSAPAEDELRQMIAWYQAHAVLALERTLRQDAGPSSA